MPLPRFAYISPPQDAGLVSRVQEPVVRELSPHRVYQRCEYYPDVRGNVTPPGMRPHLLDPEAASKIQPRLLCVRRYHPHPPSSTTASFTPTEPPAGTGYLSPSAPTTATTRSYYDRCSPKSVCEDISLSSPNSVQLRENEEIDFLRRELAEAVATRDQLRAQSEVQYGPVSSADAEEDYGPDVQRYEEMEQVCQGLRQCLRDKDAVNQELRMRAEVLSQELEQKDQLVQELSARWAAQEQAYGADSMSYHQQFSPEAEAIPCQTGWYTVHDDVPIETAAVQCDAAYEHTDEGNVPSLAELRRQRVGSKEVPPNGSRGRSWQRRADPEPVPKADPEPVPKAAAVPDGASGVARRRSEMTTTGRRTSQQGTRVRGTGR